ncbi:MULTISPECIES: hypothetical protein [Aminobacter]|jgi:hypothetical protein|uniref:Uncharacterized protein n=2 Tax=Aminobacter TaxID=31988 RepID=A0AAC8YQM6_AMIAI|nr:MULTISPECIES: hypothetical protein [Aminobacter]AMS42334.1 hypothetical protein AA2016_3412 [Aminobacter aminovorans]MBA8906631.1 hypothetical protein [Aminobacter ciceronei]MBA9020243.1 hypothetical protein [Aminobacter ciceronei]MBB3709075.1 hypothetical protein [Aminobacter aminovorans]WMC94630.1 hypothetical protein RAR13_14555 [Aminobacter aminovorans]
MEKHLLSIVWLMAVSIGPGVPIVASLHFSRKLTRLNCIAWALVAEAAVGIAFCLFTIPPDYEAALSQRVFLSAGFAAVAALTALAALAFFLIAGLRLSNSPSRDA